MDYRQVTGEHGKLTLLIILENCKRHERWELQEELRKFITRDNRENRFKQVI